MAAGWLARSQRRTGLAMSYPSRRSSPAVRRERWREPNATHKATGGGCRGGGRGAVVSFQRLRFGMVFCYCTEVEFEADNKTRCKGKFLNGESPAKLKRQRLPNGRASK